jgi:hypothetical protein
LRLCGEHGIYDEDQFNKSVNSVYFRVIPWPFFIMHRLF